MMRAPLIEVSLEGLHRKPKFPTHEVVTERGNLSIVEKPTRAIFTLKEPGVMYTDRFANNAALYLSQGKYVEVKCGTNHELAKELTEGSPKANVEVQHDALAPSSGKKIVAEVIQNRQPGISGWVLPKEVSVIYRRVTDDTKLITNLPSAPLATNGDSAFLLFPATDDRVVDHDELALEIERFLNDPTEHVRQPWEDAYVVNLGSSLELGDQVQVVLRFLDNALSVNIPTQIFSGKHDPDGIIIERDIVSDETVINLNNNHGNAQLFTETVLPLAIELLRRGETVVVDYNQSRMDASDAAFAYSSVLEQIPFAGIKTEVRESNVLHSEQPHNVVVLTPFKCSIRQFPL